MSAKTEISVRVMDTDVMRDVLTLLGDAREAICSAMSEGWDRFSDATQNELTEIVERCDQVGDSRD